jgi:hypothetical protein
MRQLHEEVHEDAERCACQVAHALRERHGQLQPSGGCLDETGSRVPAYKEMSSHGRLSSLHPVSDVHARVVRV